MSTSSIAFTAGYLSLTTGIFMVLIGLMIFQKYLERKKIATFYLFLSILGWLGATWSCCVLYFVSGFNLSIAIICQKLVYANVFLGTMMTYLFASEIFFKSTQLKKGIYLGIGIVFVIIMAFTNSVSISEFPDGTGYPLLNIKLPFIILIVIYIVPTVLGLFFLALKTSKQVEEKEYKIGFKIIAIGQLFLLMTFISDTLQGIFIDEVALYATFLYLTWVFPLLTAICYYIGYIMPGWFIQWFQGKPK